MSIDIKLRSQERALLYYDEIVRLTQLQDEYLGIDLSSLIQQAVQSIDDLYIPVYISSIRSYAKQCDFDTIDELFKHINIAKWARFINSNHSTVSTLARKFADGTCHSLREAVDRFNIMLSSDTSGFFGERTKIISVKPLSDADRHNKGRQVLLFEVDNKRKFVYKPNNQYAEFAFQRFISLVMPGELGLRGPKSLNSSDANGDYSFVEFIEHEPCYTEAQISKYFYNMGQLIALSQSMSCWDLHCGNIIARAETPVVIDCECHFQNSADHQRLYDAHQTLIIQPEPDEAKKEFWVAGLCAISKYAYDPLAPRVVNESLMSIDLELGREFVSESYNLPFESETLHQAHEFEESIINGYRNACGLIVNNMHKLQSDDDFWHYLSLTRTRVLLRRTAAYSQAIRRLTMPDISDLNAARKALLNYDSKYSILNSEIDQLLNGDYPYFFTRLDSKQVFDVDGEVVLSFENTQRQSLSLSIEKISSLPVEETVDAIRACLSYSKRITVD